MLLFKNIGLLALCLLLQCCTIRPLYNLTDDSVLKLQTIKIAQIPDRLGQQLRNRLSYRLQSNDNTFTESHYLLTITLSDTRSELSFRKDFTPRRAELEIIASFKLEDVKRGTIVYESSSIGYNAYSVGPTSDFSSFHATTAEQSAKNRILDIISDDIILQLTSYFKNLET